MRLSTYLLPTLKENPAEAQTLSHRLMLRAGMIRQHAAGIYNWLPLGLRVLHCIEKIVREEQNAIGAQEILMPTIQSADLWRESGRYEDYGKEMLRIIDRHERALLYGPTHEEVVTDVFRQSIKSYRELPKVLFQIHWKFRDEIRPRFGVMRGREFLMNDAYSFDLNYVGARQSYNRMFVAYMRIFSRMGLKVIPVRASSGPIGGSLSHEFIVLAATGESHVFCHKELLNKTLPDVGYDNKILEQVVEDWTRLYAVTSEKHNLEVTTRHPSDRIIATKGIEVGHIFYFGRKYSDPMRAVVSGPNKEQIAVEMGSYGIGISRLVGAIIEVSHDNSGIIWPVNVAPFTVGLISLQEGAIVEETCQDLYAQLNKAGIAVLYDDRCERAGTKFANMDLIGLPWQIIVGERRLAQGLIELKNRATGIREEIPLETIIDYLAKKISQSC